jgi:PAS domain S-box-containing protein
LQTHEVVNASELTAVSENDLLRAEAATLEQLMSVFERTTLEQTLKLEEAISARSAAAEELRLQLETTRALTESMGEGVLAFDDEGRLTLLNPAAESMLGISAANSRGKSLQDLGFARRSDTTHALQRVFATRETVRNDDEVFRNASGEPLPVSYTASPILAAGHFLGAVLVFHDITSRKRADEERQKLLEVEREARVTAERAREISRFLAEAGSVLVSSLDSAATLERVARLAIPAFADWSFVHLLDSAGTLRRVTAAHSDPKKEALLRGMEDTYPPSNEDASGPAHVTRTGTSEFVPAFSDELVRASAKDSSHLQQLQQFGFTSYVSVPLIARKRTLGAMTFAMAESGRHYREDELLLAQQLADRAALAIDNARLFAEVTEAGRELEQRVRARTTQLEEANRELEAFSYSVSHDLRAPIRHISGFVDLLRRSAGDTLDPKSAHYVKIITDSVKQAGNLVDDLLAFSRMGRAELAHQRLSMDALVQEVRKALDTEIGNRTIEWTVGTLGNATGDAAMLRLVWRNLLSNAVKYTRMREVATIEIGKQPGDGEDVYSVRDNGAGFDMKYVGKLFGVFQRLHPAEQFEGTGIGLANVRRIVSRHGGRAWAEGEVGAGSTFYFALPRRESEEIH